MATSKWGFAQLIVCAFFLLLAPAADLTSDACLGVRADAQAPKTSTLEALLAERLATAREVLQLATEAYKSGRGSFDGVSAATRLVLDAELDQCPSEKDRVKVLEKFVATAKESEQRAERLFRTGAAPLANALQAKADRLQVQISLERAKAKVAAGAK